MMNALLGSKIEQSQAFTEDGKRIPVTVITAGPCWITQITNTDTYRNVQIGFGTTKHLSKAEIGHIKKAGLDTKLRFLRTIRLTSDTELGELKVGSIVNVADVFTVGDAIRVTGISKGKGFASGIKRYHFKGGPRTHGQSDRERAPGSLGQTTTPGRVYKGKRMAGRMGNDQVTVRNLKVVSVDTQKNQMTIKGLVPGAKSALLIIQKEL